jgi:hypothetical protein
MRNLIATSVAPSLYAFPLNVLDGATTAQKVRSTFHRASILQSDRKVVEIGCRPLLAVCVLSGRDDGEGPAANRRRLLSAFAGVDAGQFITRR